MPKCVPVPNLEEFYRSAQDACVFLSIILVYAKFHVQALRDTLGASIFEDCLSAIQNVCVPAKIRYMTNLPDFHCVVYVEGSSVCIERSLDAVAWLMTPKAQSFSHTTLLTMLRQRMETQARLRFNIWMLEPAVYKLEMEANKTFLPSLPSVLEMFSPTPTPVNKPVNRRLYSEMNTDSDSIMFSPSSRTHSLPEENKGPMDQLWDQYQEDHKLEHTRTSPVFERHCLDVVLSSPESTVATISPASEHEELIFSFDLPNDQHTDKTRPNKRRLRVPSILNSSLESPL